MNIGEAAAKAGVSAKRVRHYEAIGLIGKAARTGSNYRTYTETDVHTLQFVQRARDLGFAIEDIRALLGLWQDHKRPSREVKRLAQRHAEGLRGRIAGLQGMLDALAHLARHCHGDDRPDCPILKDLAQGNSQVPRRSAKGV